MIDNRAARLQAGVRIVGGSVIAPLRFVSEALWSRVDWGDSTQTVSISSDNGHFLSRGLRPVKRRQGFDNVGGGG